MKQKTYLTCVGTRPEIIKMAPVYKALKARGHDVRVMHTGQHEEIAHALYRFFEMPPDIVIDLKRKSGSLADLTAVLLEKLDGAIRDIDPDVIMVQGDTTSAFVGALIGYYHNKPVAHIEAGLRTREREPFPEEKNRELIGRLAQWHFPPTQQARYNLIGEGVYSNRIFEVGNTVIDAAQWTRDRITQPSFDWLASAPDNLRAFHAVNCERRIVLITAHRRENWGEPIRNIAKAAAAIVSAHPDVAVVWPVHPNPSVRADVGGELAALPADVQARICLTEPLGYQELIGLLVNCEFTLTDSGGIQEEASAFAKPVLIARKSTERQELVNAGGARLVGTEVESMVAAAHLLLSNVWAYRKMQLKESPFGDGRSAERIAEILGDSAADAANDMPFMHASAKRAT